MRIASPNFPSAAKSTSVSASLATRRQSRHVGSKHHLIYEPFGRIGGAVAVMLTQLKDVLGAAGKPPATPSVRPNMLVAAKAFSSIAIARKHNAFDDYERAAWANAESLRREGASVVDALSAYWGGHCAAQGDLGLFWIGVDAYDETAHELGRSAGTPEARFYAGATMYLGTLLAAAPGDYERFLSHLNA